MVIRHNNDSDRPLPSIKLSTEHSIEPSGCVEGFAQSDRQGPRMSIMRIQHGHNTADDGNSILSESLMNEQDIPHIIPSTHRFISNKPSILTLSFNTTNTPRLLL